MTNARIKGITMELSKIINAKIRELRKMFLELDKTQTI
jgi:hypothetical protein